MKRSGFNAYKPDSNLAKLPASLYPAFFTIVEEMENITIFWDFETTHSSSAVSAVSTYEMVRNIRSTIATYGQIQSIRLYWDYGGHTVQSSTIRIRSELSSSGVGLIDCPFEARKGGAMKKMLVDMCLHAWDIQLPHTLVVITGDRDAAYALSMLRTKNYKIVLISPAGSHIDLTAQANVQLDWSRTVLGIGGGNIRDEDLFQEVPPRMTSAPVPDPPRPIRGTSGLHHDAPQHDNSSLGRWPYRSYDPSFGVFGDVRYTSPKATTSLGFGFGDGPLFPRPQSTTQNPSRSGSLPPKDTDKPNSGSKPSPFIFKGKGKSSEPDGIFPPQSGISASAFEPFGDGDDGSPSRLSTSPSSALKTPPQQSVVTQRSDSLKSNFSFIGAPEETGAAKSTYDVVNGQREGQVPASPVKSPQGSSVNPAAVKPAATEFPPQPLPSVASRTSPPKAVMPQTNAPRPPPQVTSHGASKSATKRLPPTEWRPLVDVLRKHQGVIARDALPTKLLKSYPNAYKTAGHKKYTTYLDDALTAGIVLNYYREGSCEIRLNQLYV